MDMIEWMFAKPVNSVPSAPILRANKSAALYALRDLPLLNRTANILNTLACLDPPAIASHLPLTTFDVTKKGQLTKPFADVALTERLVHVSSFVRFTDHHTATNEARSHPSRLYLNTRAFFTFSERGWNPTSRRMSRAAWM